MMKLSGIDQQMTIKKATYINAVSKYSVFILNFMFTAILARILTPEDYGVVAVVTVFSAFFMMIAEMGLGSAIIRNIKLTREDEERIYTATLYLGVLFAVLFSFFSTFLVKLYDNEVYYSVGILLALYLGFSIFNIVPQAILLKNKLFGLVAVRSIVSCILGFAVAILVAFMGGKYYALIIQMMINIVFMYAWNMKRSGLKVRHKGMFGSVKIVLSFTIFQSVFNFVTYIARNLDNLLVGYFISDVALGLYNKSYELMRSPVELLSSLVTPTLLPMLSDKQEDKEYILMQYNKICKILILSGTFISVFCFYASREIIFVLFGDQWEGAVGAFHWFSLGIVMQLVVMIRGAIYQLFGVTRKLSRAGIIESIIIVIAICIGTKSGDIEILSICYVIGFVFYFLHCQYSLAKDCFEASSWSVFKAYLLPSVIYVVLFIFMYFIPTLDNIFASFMLKGVTAGIVYVILLRVTKEFRYLLLVLPDRFTRKVARDIDL